MNHCQLSLFVFNFHLPQSPLPTLSSQTSLLNGIKSSSLLAIDAQVRPLDVDSGSGYAWVSCSRALQVCLLEGLIGLGPLLKSRWGSGSFCWSSSLNPSSYSSRHSFITLFGCTQVINIIIFLYCASGSEHLNRQGSLLDCWIDGSRRSFFAELH